MKDQAEGSGVHREDWLGSPQMGRRWLHRSNMLFQQTHKMRRQRSPSHSQEEVEVEQVLSRGVERVYEGKSDQGSQD